MIIFPHFLSLYVVSCNITQLDSQFSDSGFGTLQESCDAQDGGTWNLIPDSPLSFFTGELLDIAAYLAEHADEPAARLILENFTLLMIPMLNPDGAENYVRRNAQGIDINRDALNLATPEGQTLKRIRDEYEPMMGFNLQSIGKTNTILPASHLY